MYPWSQAQSDHWTKVDVDVRHDCMNMYGANYYYIFVSFMPCYCIWPMSHLKNQRTSLNNLTLTWNWMRNLSWMSYGFLILALIDHIHIQLCIKRKYFILFIQVVLSYFKSYGAIIVNLAQHLHDLDYIHQIWLTT